MKSICNKNIFFLKFDILEKKNFVLNLSKTFFCHFVPFIEFELFGKIPRKTPVFTLKTALIFPLIFDCFLLFIANTICPKSGAKNSEVFN